MGNKIISKTEFFENFYKNNFNEETDNFLDFKQKICKKYNFQEYEFDFLFSEIKQEIEEKVYFEENSYIANIIIAHQYASNDYQKITVNYDDNGNMILIGDEKVIQDLIDDVQNSLEEQYIYHFNNAYEFLEIKDSKNGLIESLIDEFEKTTSDYTILSRAELFESFYLLIKSGISNIGESVSKMQDFCAEIYDNLPDYAKEEDASRYDARIDVLKNIKEAILDEASLEIDFLRENAQDIWFCSTEIYGEACINDLEFSSYGMIEEFEEEVFENRDKYKSPATKMFLDLAMERLGYRDFEHFTNDFKENIRTIQ